MVQMKKTYKMFLTKEGFERIDKGELPKELVGKNQIPVKVVIKEDIKK